MAYLLEKDKSRNGNIGNATMGWYTSSKRMYLMVNDPNAALAILNRLAMARRK
jgi:hypothetical protein